MSKTLRAGAWFGALALSLVVAPEAARGTTMAAARQTSTFEGCLGAGSRSGEFALTVGKDRFTVVPGIGVDLAAHLNHTVKVSGTVDDRGAAKVVRATAVEMVATTCGTAFF